MRSAKLSRCPRTVGLSGLAVLALVVTGCGNLVHHEAGSENNGVYVNAGPITYQLQISRELNQYATEDSQYLVGVPSSDRTLRADQLWYGVFLWAFNQNKVLAPTTGKFVIEDTEGRRYFPIPISHAVNPYVWNAQTLPPKTIQPLQDTTASFGPTQGSMLLFKLDTSVYDNRPLTLEILGPSRQVWGTISLDL